MEEQKKSCSTEMKVTLKCNGCGLAFELLKIKKSCAFCAKNFCAKCATLEEHGKDICEFEYIIVTAFATPYPLSPDSIYGLKYST